MIQAGLAPSIETDRLILRRWLPSDLQPFARMNADPEVMEFFPATMSTAETETMLKTIEEKFERDGFCFWAAELKETRKLVGFIGLNVPGIETHFTPCVEIGWRLSREYWGNGFAQEGARASLKWGFDVRGLREIVSFTTVQKQRSRRVMERIGMSYDPQDDFDHPKLPKDHPIRRHVLYRLSREKQDFLCDKVSQASGLVTSTAGSK